MRLNTCKGRGCHAPRFRSVRGLGEGRKGTACVEFAFLAPFLALLFVITMDYSQILYAKITINQCARNGALYGANLRSYLETTWVTPYNTGTPTDDNIKAVAIADGAGLNPALTTSQVQVTHNKGSDGNDAVQVTVSYTFTTICPVPGFGSSFNLQATSSMRVAQ